MTHDHNTITFEGFKGIKIETCPNCGRQRWLGVLGDGCRFCQSCYHKEHGLGKLPSDEMYP